MRVESSNPAFTRGVGIQQTPGLQRLSYEDVLVHTGGLFVLLLATAAAGWTLVGTSDIGAPLALGAAFAALGLSFFISFSQKVRVGAIILFAALEGLFLGGISRIFENAYEGIVIQALVGVAAVFTSMLLLYRSGKIRATPKMRKIVFASMMGVIGVSLVDFVLRLTTDSAVPLLNDASPLGILISVGIIVLAAFMLILDFDHIDRAVQLGAEKQEAWRCAFGLMVSLAWAYVEFLRLLSKLRDS